MNKDVVIAKLVYFLYQLGFVAVVGGFIAFLMMIMGIDIKEKAGVIGVVAVTYWGVMQQEYKKKAGKDDNERKDK